MNQGTIYVSAFTPTYAAYADRLRVSLQRFGLESYMEKLEDRGSWHKNCAQKPEVLLRAMNLFPDRAIVWLDADAEVVQEPVLFGERDLCFAYKTPVPDLAAYFKDGQELLTGTLYLAPTVRVQRLLEAWQAACTQDEREWDQRLLQRLLNNEFLSVHVGELPESYCHIFDQPIQEKPVIVQYQASRETRKL